MSVDAQGLFTIALAIGGGVLMLYWIVCTFILLCGGDPGKIHRR
jgi:hypothetical protein